MGSNLWRSEMSSGGTQCGSPRYRTNGYPINRFRSALDRMSLTFVLKAARLSRTTLSVLADDAQASSDTGECF